ncbi:MAG: tetratricopeptide repeat protein [Planctomycetes bacterium]|nr:tetratricopeptide repeat protein [Planctomycetota bacterium]
MKEVRPSSRLGETFQAAARAFGARDWPQAEALCRQVLLADPRHSDALHMLALVFSETGRPDAAIAKLREATAVQPNNPIQWTNLGKIYRDTGQPAEAVECHRRAIALKEDFPEAHFNLGLAYEDLGKFDEAIAAVRRATELRPGYAAAHYNLGNLLRAKGLFRKAVGAYETALQIRSDLADAHMGIALAWQALGESEHAAEHYRHVLRLFPVSEAARKSARQALKGLGQLEEGAIGSVRFADSSAEAVALDRPLNWVFFDALQWEYDLATPLTAPMGGSQSALCYLARALAARGHGVTLLTGTKSPRIVDGIRCLSNTLPLDVALSADTIVVVLNGPAELAAPLRHGRAGRQLFVLWTQHAHDQPHMHALLDPACAALWDRIVCVSGWQRKMYHRCFQVAEDRMDVLRNAISPAFERMFQDAAELAEAKSAAMRLAYTSTPFRGLDVLVSCFPEIRRRHAECHLDVFSSMQIYGGIRADDEHQPIYDRCRATDGIAYRGSVPQTELAQELRGVRVLAYPNTFAETSCIAVMEALAAGALVVTSDLGALPETCAGWARLVPRISRQHPREQFEPHFGQAVVSALDQMQTDWSAAVAERYRQVEAINAACTWKVRAAEWEAAAARWLQPSHVSSQ